MRTRHVAVIGASVMIASIAIHAGMVSMTTHTDSNGFFRYTLQGGDEPFRWGGRVQMLALELPARHILGIVATPDWAWHTNEPDTIVWQYVGSNVCVLDNNSSVTFAYTSAVAEVQAYDDLSPAGEYVCATVVGEVYDTNHVLWTSTSDDLWSVASVNVAGYERVAFEGPMIPEGGVGLVAAGAAFVAIFRRRRERHGGNRTRGSRSGTVSSCVLFLMVVSVVVAGSAVAQTGPGNAVSLQSSAAQYVTAAIPAQASNYTISAWVFLRAGGNYWGVRRCVLGGSNTVEVLVRSATTNDYDPQYLELGRWGVFNGQPSTVPVPTNEWVHLAVVVSASKQISYFINGSMAGSWDGAGYDLSLGTTNILLGDNAIRRFDGVLDEVRIWNTARSQAGIQADMSRRLAGSEAGLLAYWRFDEASGAVASNSATATGAACHGTLVNGPARVPSGIPFVPDPATLFAANIGHTNATLFAAVHPGNLPTAAWFEWGMTTNYGNATAISNLAATNRALAVQVTLSVLSPGTRYYFRVAATNAIGAAAGAGLPFDTLPPSGTHSPQGSNKTITVSANETVAIVQSDWGFSDPLDSPPDNFVAVKLANLPSAGQVQVDDVNATSGQIVSMILPGPPGVTWTMREIDRRWRPVASSADGTRLVAAVAFGQIYTSTDSGENWYPRLDEQNWSGLASSADGTKLVAAASSGRIYTSTDAGTNWTARESTRYWRSVASSADGTKLVAVAQASQIYTSTDAGTNWTARGPTGGWNNVASSADGTRLVATVYQGRIYTSTDAGTNWTARENSRPWSGVASSADGTQLAAVSWGGQIYVSTDAGTNWTARENNRKWSGVASSADGSNLVAVAEGDRIYTSTDAGANWTARERSRDWFEVASSADGSKLVATVYDGRIYTSVRTPPVVTYTAPPTPGTYTLEFQVQDDGMANNMDPSPNTLTFNVPKFDQAPLVFTPTSPQAYRTTNALTTTGGSGTGALSYAVLSGPGIIVDGTNLTVTASTGTVEIVVTKAGDNVYHAASATGSVVCTKANQTITFPAIGDQAMTNKVRLTATASSGLPVSFAVGSGPGVIEGGTNLTFTRAGTVAIVASQAGDANWHAAPSVTNTFNVIKVYLAPEGSDKTIPLNMGQTIVITKEDWGFSDPLDNPPDNFVAVTLTSLPWAGEVQVNGVPATNGQVVSMLLGPGGEAWTARMTDSNRYWNAVASSADGTRLVAAAYQGWIYTSMDAGTSWTARITDLNRFWWTVASSADGTKLAAGVNGGLLYTSTNAGTNWTGSNYQQWYSVASSADGKRLVGAALSGRIHTSTDGGMTWTTHLTSQAWTCVASSADGTRLVAAAYQGWLYTSTDAGTNWTAWLSNSWRCVASSADGTKLVAAEFPGRIYTTTDAGTNWTARMTDTNRQWRAVASSADGTKLVAVENNGTIYTSADAGVNWIARMTDTNRQWRAVASSADGSQLLAGEWGGKLYVSVGTPAVITYTAPSTPGKYALDFQVHDDGASINTIDLSPNTLTFDVLGFWLDTEAGPHGSVDVADHWLAPGVTTQITAIADQYYYFTNWTGNVSGADVYANPLHVFMDMSKTVMAHFAALVTTNTGTPYWWLARFGITSDFEAAVLEDPDMDGISTGQEYVMNTDPTNGLSFLRIARVELVHRTNEAVRHTLLSWHAATDRVYAVEVNVASPAFVWAPVPGMTNLVSHTGFLTVTNVMNANQKKMYRVRVRLP